LEGMTLRGEHNAWNGALALRACEAFGAAGDHVTEAIRAFRGLPHRLQDLGLFDGVRCINDSKSTTPRAALLAIDAYRGEPLRVIVGGYDKKIDLSPLADAQDVTLYAIGETAGTLCAGRARAIACGTLEHAVDRAFRDASPGDVLLLSPGCASWDQFEHFEARGETFATLVRRAHRPTPSE
ncbi:MAG: hypothetical protein KDA28_15315, partial [Phycisphaerales bacterium]|nr:hypothetical protein [Phycisphaerales bacterium]